jgi:GNAT superfamily N-acetyltransferase
MSYRRSRPEDIVAILSLYALLHPDDPIQDANDRAVKDTWSRIGADQKLHYFVAEDKGMIVSTCALAVIPNLTRGLRSYGVIENVVTVPDSRRKGFATKLLQMALDEAWKAECYKVMLSTGSKNENTLKFYEDAGFKRGVKTGFVAYPPAAN